MHDIFSLWRRIEKRRGMYLLGEDDVEQLRHLQSLLTGYELALADHNVGHRDQLFMKKFGEYLRDRFGWSMSTGPIDTILRESATPQEAWTTLGRLLREYEEERNGQ